MKRLLAVVMAMIAVIVFAGCYTTNADNITDHAADLHSKVKCFGGGPEGHGWYHYQLDGGGGFTRVSPEYRFDCSGPSGYSDGIKFRTGYLAANWPYRVRLGYRLDNGDTGWFDKDGTLNGANYTQFETDGGGGGEVGGEGSTTDPSASVDADRLCRWTTSYRWNNYLTSYPKAGGWVGCNSDLRKVDIGCSLTFYYTGGSKDSADGLGTGHTTSCSKSATGPEWSKGKSLRWAFSVRLQNPDRAWRKTFRSGDSIDCDTYRDTEHRDVMHCVRWEYNPRLPVGPQ